MNTEDISKWITMLNVLYPNAPERFRYEKKDKQSIGILKLALEPYTYEQVRAATIERYRTNIYYPDKVQDIICLIPGAAAPAANKYGFSAPGEDEIRAVKETAARAALLDG